MALNGLNGQMFGCGIGRIDSSHRGVKTSTFSDRETGQSTVSPTEKRGREEDNIREK